MAGKMASMYLFLFFIILFSFPSNSTSQITPNESEKQTLLRIKSDWGNPTQLASWSNTTTTSYCNWTGIECSSNGAVISIDLPNQNLSGDFSEAVCDLKSLSFLNISYNNVGGAFPASLYNCSKLEYLDLYYDFFVGELPADIYRLSSSLIYLNFGGNNFTGDIPPSVGRLTLLKTLYLDSNLFNGTFPAEIGNLSNLETLTLANNIFMPAAIPEEFGKLSKLRFLWMAGINLVGQIPESMAGLTAMDWLDLSRNSLTGSIPAGIWNLKNLRFLYLYQNSLSGSIKINVSIGAESLERIDLSSNQINGSIPESFGSLQKLWLLFMYNNRLSGEIPASLGLLPLLSDIRLFNNSLTGVLPPELGKHSALWNLEVDDNKITGEIPVDLCAAGVFTNIVVFNNNMSGTIPESLGGCVTLDNIQIQNNRFTGDVPVGIWSATNLTTVIMSGNALSGTLPDKLPWNLTRLQIENNRFTGSIPSSAGQLYVLRANDNLFSGEFPKSLAGISRLQTLLLGGNQISGGIPESISTLTSLTVLDLSRNDLSGVIPAGIGSLPVLTSLDLSSNRLSGEIPSQIGNLKLNYLNLSSNDLSGEIPASLESPAYDSSFLSNPLLCSSDATLSVRSCSRRSNGSGGLSHGLLFLVLGAVVFLIAVASAFAFIVIREYRRRSDGSDPATWKLTSFQVVNFSENAIVRGLVDENLIGSGGGGKVYRISLGSRVGEIVAVKKIYNARKLDSKLEREFESEVKILGSIRHTNIVKLLCCISSADSKLLVYEYMENGSLDRWIHRTRVDQSKGLDWPTRYQIAVGAAKGLCYMHHESSPPIVHRDVKSSNILLDSEFRARIADFGLARMLVKAGEPDIVSAVAGSFGYLAPESAYTRKVNEKVDVYSFGVVLLELTTGREANDGDEHGSLAEWAWRHFQSNEISEAIAEEIRDPIYLAEIEVVFKLGVICTGTLPSTRPTMKEVLQVLLRCEELRQVVQQEKSAENDATPLLQTKKGSRRKGPTDADAAGGNEKNFDCNV